MMQRVDDPIFLVGTTRAGTTLLSLMLGHHPQIAFVGELEWIWDFPEAASGHLAPYHAWLATHRHFLHHHLRIDPKLAFSDLARSFLQQMREESDPGLTKPRVGCQVHRHYAEAFDLWPNARFIHIVRDGRDVCASWLKFGWLGNGYQAGVRWRDAIAEWQALAPSLPRERRTEVRFEELIRFPERELRRLCEFLGTPYSGDMLRYHEDTTYEPIDPGQSGKWRKQLARRDLRQFEAVAGSSLSSCGYALSGEAPYRLAPWSGTLLRLEDKARHHGARARLLGTRLWLADIVARRIGTRSFRDRVRLQLNAVESSRIK